jgi:redox-sensitive bicupin YhaK (pirin superfamily)
MSDPQLEQELPDGYSGFMYVLEGDLEVGAQHTRLTEGQVGWLADAVADTPGVSPLHVTAGEHGARIVLYAGERQNVPIVLHGPFVGETRADLMRLSKLYVDRKMPRISELARAPNTVEEATSADRHR